MRETLSPSRTKINTKTLLHTLTKYTNSPVQPSQSSPPSLSPAHSPPNSPTSVQSPLPPLQNTPTYHRAFIQLHTLIYLKRHTGPLDVSREGGASASQVERTPGRATVTSWVVGPLHSYTQEGWVDDNTSHERNVVLDGLPLPISSSEKDLTRKEHSTLAQLRSGYCRLLGSYKSRIKKDASLNVCADCSTTPHDVKHLFVCTAHPTTMIPSDLWSRRETQIEMNMD